MRCFFWSVFSRIRTECRYLLRPNHSVRIRENTGQKTPRQVKELIPFENDLVELITNIKFRKIKNTFHEKLKEDIKLIKDSHKTVTFATRPQICMDDSFITIKDHKENFNNHPTVRLINPAKN